MEAMKPKELITVASTKEAKVKCSRNSGKHSTLCHQDMVSDVNCSFILDGGFPPYGRADRQRAAGFTRKAVESSDEEEPVEKKPKYREK